MSAAIRCPLESPNHGLSGLLLLRIFLIGFNPIVTSVSPTGFLFLLNLCGGLLLGFIRKFSVAIAYYTPFPFFN
jgi:hypothetical protein